MERAAGIEPASTAWKAVVLPLNYARDRVSGGPDETRTRLLHLDRVAARLLRLRDLTRPLPDWYWRQELHLHCRVRSPVSCLLNDASVTDLVPAGGIEPPSTVYKTAALPLSYPGELVAGVGIAPTLPAHETGVLLLDHPARTGGGGGSRTLVVAVQERCSPVELHPRDLVEQGGIEPPSPALQAGAETTSATAP